MQLKAAIRLKEEHEATVTAILIGPENHSKSLSTALAMGADAGIHVIVDHNLTPETVATILHKIIDEKDPDLVMMGKKSVGI